MKWPKVALGECCDIVSGATPKTSVPNYWDGDILWVTPADLSQLPGSTISETPRRITQAGLDSCAATVLPAGSVLFSSRAPIGHVAINSVPMATNQGFKSLVPHLDRVDARYLYHWLRANKTYLQSLGNGATFKELSRATVARVEMPLPPLPEQRRTAAILDQADALRAKRRQTIALLDDLVQSIFIDMFGDANGSQQEAAPLGSVATLFPGGTLPQGREFAGQRDGYFLMKVSDMNGPGNELLVKTCTLWSPDAGSRSATCPEGSIVLPKRGGAIGTNKKRITTRPTVLDPNLMGIWPDPAKLELAYVYQWFRGFDLATITSGSTVPQLNKQDLAPLPIAIPPMAQQREFVRRAKLIGQKAERNRSYLSQADALFTGLQAAAFNEGGPGRLGGNADPPPRYQD